MITSPPWILQYNSVGSFEWSSWRPGLGNLIQVGASGHRAYAVSQCRMGRWAIRIVCWSAGEGDRTRHISGHVQGESVVMVTAQGYGRWVTQSAQLGRETGREIRLSWRRGWRIALRSIPIHGDPAAALDCCTLAAAAAAGRLWKATPSKGKVLERGTGFLDYYHTCAESTPCCFTNLL